MVVYSLDPVFGSIELATRSGTQAKLQWKKGKVPASATPLEWSWDSPKGELRAQCVDPKQKLRLIWTFPGADEQTARGIVAESVGLSPSSQGLSLNATDAQIPEKFKPVEVQLHPANVMLSLEGPRESRLVHRCWGLPDIVLQGKPPAEFFQRMLMAMQFRVSEVTPVKLHDWQAYQASFSSRGLSPLARLLFQRAKGQGWIWLDEKEKRLKTLEMLGPNRDLFPSPEECVYVG